MFFRSFLILHKLYIKFSFSIFSFIYFLFILKAFISLVVDFDICFFALLHRNKSAILLTYMFKVNISLYNYIYLYMYYYYFHEASENLGNGDVLTRFSCRETSFICSLAF